MSERDGLIMRRRAPEQRGVDRGAAHPGIGRIVFRTGRRHGFREAQA
ncbi:hypothetical protein [Nocardia bhagyanarayanae]|uniref:Uncharacterized protein n=1 Tax=Nocardia bhagyanarayanae TaxID=1215925 RepID=A0A543F8D6_9NOCA|nr:hypothetical protein [Nocardia bhagyanarayanae]TQM30071.1 hypothetical protein FB390_1687 [Nocardia bhagyanarayanae]